MIATQTADTYLPAETYTNVVEALVGLARTLHAASFDHDAIRTFLGESLNVWPQEVADDLDAERYQERIAGRFPTPTSVSLSDDRPASIADIMSPNEIGELDFTLEQLAGTIRQDDEDDF